MKKSTTTFKKPIKATVLIAVAVVVGFFAVPITQVKADTWDDQIRAIEAEIDSYEAQAGEARAKADTLQAKVNSLNAQKRTIQAQINLNQVKRNQLVAKIRETEKKITQMRGVLGDVLADIYVDSDISPLEMLATSKSMSDFMDKQQYQNTIRNKLNNAIKEIKELKAKLDEQKIEVEQVLSDQESQRRQLAAKEQEQQSLLAETRGQEAAYQSMIKSRESKIQELYDEQRRRLLQAGGQIIAGDPNKGGYPAEYANAPLDSLVDRWGMYNRECVSYTAWKVYQKNGYMPHWGGIGNANQWPGNADSAGIPRGSSPRAKSVAIIYSVYPNDIYGHAAWVESVNGSDVIVSQYNWGSPGGYSEMRVSASFFDTYIYF